MSDIDDLSQFREIFIAEAKEHLSHLNANLLELEKKPTEPDLLNEVFRASHTIKGMAATMGFEKITLLTHSMENVLDKLRSGKITANTETIDVLFDCFDTLEVLLGEIETGKDTGIDVQVLVNKLKLAEISQLEETEEKKTSESNKISEAATEPSVEDYGVIKESAIPAPASEPAAGTEQESKAAGDAEHISQTVRIRVEHLDKLMNLVGELVITKAQLIQVAEKERIGGLSTTINSISQYTTELQEAVLKTRMVPVKHIFDRYPRMIRDLSHKLGKEIDFIMTGAEIEVDRVLLDQINEPLVHLLRNSVDHGVELPDARKYAGKDETGTIRLAVKREKGYVWIEVSDDGKGMDPNEIRQHAVEKGIITHETGQKLSDAEAFMLICHPGFSTAETVTDISGRGVGMDVVKNLVETFNGKMEIISRKNRGSTFVLQLPLTMAIIQALLVQVGVETYAIPLSNIDEIARVEKDYLKTIDKQEVMLLRNEVVPLVRIADFFNSAENGVEAGKYSVIVELSGKRIGLVIDNLIGKQEIVVKTLSGILRGTKHFSGATILGGGQIVLIVDVSSIV